jgi:hypothetical protein
MSLNPESPGHVVFCKKIVLKSPHVASHRTVEHVMKTLDATSRAGGAVAVVALSAVLSGCNYSAPYGYVPYGELPATTAQQYPFTIADFRHDFAKRERHVHVATVVEPLL